MFYILFLHYEKKSNIIIDDAFTYDGNGSGLSRTGK